jgi:hypothetical protein
LVRKQDVVEVMGSSRNVESSGWGRKEEQERRRKL